MRSKVLWTLAAAFAFGALFVISAHPQFASGNINDWTTSRYDAQRTAWRKTDQYISVANMRLPGFTLQWKTRVNNQARQMNSLVGAATLGANFNPLSFVTGSSNNVIAIDNDTGVEHWTRHIDAPLGAATSQLCPGGMTAAVSRTSTLALTEAAGRRNMYAMTRGPYQGAVGKPGEGVPSSLLQGGMFGPGSPNPFADRGPNAAGGAAAGGAAAAAGGRNAQAAGAPAAGAPAAGGAAAGGRNAQAAGAAAAARSFGRAFVTQYIYAVSSDGVLHRLGQLSGVDQGKPLPFLPADAKVSSLIDISDVVYATTQDACGGAANGVWSINVANNNGTVDSWKTNGGSPVGEPAFGSDGTVYVAIGQGNTSANGYSDAVVALDPKTLQPKDWFTQANADFSSTPMILTVGKTEIVAAATRDGRVFLLNAKSLGGSSHGTPLYASPAYSSGLAPTALAGGQDSSGATWILEPFGGPLPASVKLAPNSGTITHGGILALKVANANGNFSLQPAWVSPDMVSPLPPIVINGVVFALSSGQYEPGNTSVSVADRVSHSVPAKLYAFEATTGLGVWNSGNSLATFSSTGLWASVGQVYVATHDNVIYAFGFPMGRYLPGQTPPFLNPNW